jgi:hypothetical protein
LFVSDPEDFDIKIFARHAQQSIANTAPYEASALQHRGLAEYPIELWRNKNHADI